MISLAVLISLLISGSTLTAEPHDSELATLPEIVIITASEKSVPPAWALMQQQLIRTINEAAPVFLDRFTRRDGTLYNYGEWDDVYEMFYNWSLFYAIGGDEYTFDRALRQYNVLTRQGTVIDAPRTRREGYFVSEPSLYKEFTKAKDWFHISEGMTAFYDLAVGDPAIHENINRARRFAGFYLNEDTEAPNFDPDLKIIRAAATGSDGPAERHYDAAYNLSYGHASLYPFVEEVEKDWNKNPARREELLRLYNEIVTPCDVPVNLYATGLMTNAYLYTGDEKYKTWVLDYVDAWMERIRLNNGILPDNIGRSGTIGEYRKGQWWGGLYGWSARYSNHMIFSALSVATECAFLVSGGDTTYLDLLRSQIDVLLEQAKTSPEGQFQVPYKYGREGWHDYRPMNVRGLAHLWHASMDQGDWERIMRVRKASSDDWGIEPSTGDRCAGRTEASRLMYYAGENPDWPLEILRADYRVVLRRLEFMRTDTRDVRTLYSDDLHVNNPVLTKGLLQVTMGAPQTIYNGGLLRARVRYFDPDYARPGLPPDVAALVEELDEERTVVRLVNTNALASRRLIVQAGAFGEHTVTEVRYPEGDGNRAIPVNKKYFAVMLPPGTAIRLDIGIKRFANIPTYAFPWHGDRVPDQ